MDTVTAKTCITLTKSGQLKDVLNVLDGKYAHLKTEHAVKIIISVCNACADSVVHSRFTPNEASILVVNCMQLIQKLDNNLMYLFLSSIFHIIKYFINKEDCKCILDLQDGLIRILKCNLNIGDLDKSVNNIYKVIYNGVVTRLINKDSENLSRICRFSIKVLRTIIKLNDLLKEQILNYFKNFDYLQLELNDQCNIYQYIIDMIQEEITEENVLVYFDLTLGLLNLVLRNCIKNDKNTEAEGIINVTVKTFKDFSIGGCSDALDVIEDITKFVCYEDKFPSNFKLLVIEIQEDFQKLYEEKTFLKTIAQFSNFLCLILNYSMRSFRTFSKEFWRNFPLESIAILNRFTNQLSIALTWSHSKCRTCSEGTIHYNFASALNVLIIPMQMLKYCLSNENNSNIDEILQDIKKTLQLSSMMVQRTKEADCNDWKNLWSELGTLMFNLGVGLYRIKHAMSNYLWNNFVKKMIELEGVQKTVLQDDILNSALLYITESYISQANYKNAMTIIAFNILLHPNNGESAFWQWIRIKSNEKDKEKLQNVNLCSIIIDNETILKSLYPDFKITNEEKKQLLSYELKLYKKLWPSKISIVSAFRELHTFNDTLTTARELVLMWSNEDNTVSPDIQDIIFDVIEKFAVHCSDNIQYKFYMAHLYLIQYYVVYKKIQHKNSEEMNAIRAVNTNTQPVVDKNEECDIVTWYESLKIENHIVTMNYLKKSVSIFKDLIHKRHEKYLDEMNVYGTMNKIANNYLLHSYTLEYLETWVLCLKIAKILNDKICIIESVGYLLEKSDINSKFIKDSIMEVKKLISEVFKDDKYQDGENSIRKWIVLTNFYISRGLSMLKVGDVNTAIKFYNKAKDIYSKCDDVKKYQLLKIRFEFFEWKLQLLPCSFKIAGHTSVIIKPYLLVNAASQYYKLNGSNCYILCILFQIYLSVVHMYRWMRQPREARSYGKDIIILSQELVLPFRSIQFLTYLAEADLLSVRINDCYVKLNGIYDILGYSKDKTTSIYTTEDKKPFINEVASISNQFQEMMLDFPVTKRYQQSTSGSPLLLKHSFKIPSFLQHDKTCKCFYCLSVDYQEFVLRAITLQANLCYYENDLGAAIEYYQGALCIYRNILNNERVLQNKIDNILQLSIFPAMECNLKEIYCIILLGLGNAVVKTEKFLSISTELIGILKKAPHFNMYLYGEALFQKLNYLSSLSDEATKRSPYLSPVNDNNTIATTVTTPENKCSQVNLPVSTPFAVPKKQNTRKVIKFDLSDLEDKDNSTDTKSPMKTILNLPKTPAISTTKIKIYHPNSIKSTRKKKTDVIGDKKENIEVKFDVPKKMKSVEVKLRSRTRLLTEKLKKEASSIPNVVVTDDSGIETCSNIENNRPRTRAKKNLLAELGCENIRDASSASSETNSNTNTNNNKGAIKKRMHSRKII